MKAIDVTQEVVDSWQQGSTGESRRAGRSSARREQQDLYALVSEFEARERKRYIRHLLKERVRLRRQKRPTLWQRLTRSLRRLF